MVRVARCRSVGRSVSAHAAAHHAALVVFVALVATTALVPHAATAGAAAPAPAAPAAGLAALRTSRFQYGPGDHRAPITLELSQRVPYEARRADDAGRKDKALEIHRHLSILPSRPLQERGLARHAALEFQTGPPEEAAERCRGLLDSDPLRHEKPWAIQQIGNCLALSGDAGRACVYYEILAERRPDSFWAAFARERLDQTARPTEQAAGACAEVGQ